MTIVRYHEAAEQELLSAIGFLEASTEGLGRRFFREVQEAEDFLMKFPQAAREILPGIR